MLAIALHLICGHPVQPKTAGCISVVDPILANIVTDAWCNENCEANPDAEVCVDKCSCPVVPTDPTTLLPPADDAATDEKLQEEKSKDEESIAENRRLQADLQRQKAELVRQLEKLQDEEKTILDRMAKRDADEMTLDEPTSKGECHGTCKHLSDRFLHGKPSNDLKEVGLIVHCFDDTEKEDARWVPSEGRTFYGASYS